MLGARLLPLLVLAQTNCTALFGSSGPSEDADVIDAALGDANSDAGPPSYSLAAVWQTPTDRIVGHVALGPDQNPAFAGHFTGTVMLDGVERTSMGALDLMLTRLDPSMGTPTTWVQYGLTASEYVTSLSIGGDGDLVVAGGVEGEVANLGGVNFDPVDLLSTGFVARYGSDLAHEWSLFFGSDGNNTAVSGLSAAGQLFTCGNYAGKLRLPRTDGAALEILGQTGLTAFYAKYNENGTFASGQLRFTGEGDERCEVAVDDSLGSAYIAGSFTEDIDFSSTANFDLDAVVAQADLSTTSLFVGRIKNDTTLSWVYSIPGNEFAAPIMRGALGLDNKLVLVSEIKGTVLVPNQGTMLVTGDDEDIAIFVIEPVEGTIQVAKSFPSLGTDRAAAVTVGPSGEIAVVGRFTGKINFGGGELSSKGSDDVFIVVFDSFGEHLWSKSYGTLTSDQALSAAFDQNGALYVTVRHQPGIDFGLGPLQGQNAGAILKFE